MSWKRTDQLGYGDYDMTNCYVHELIQIDPASTRRGRVWQWFADGELILRTIIKETRTGSAESVAC